MNQPSFTAADVDLVARFSSTHEALYHYGSVDEQVSGELARDRHRQEPEFRLPPMKPNAAVPTRRRRERTPAGPLSAGGASSAAVYDRRSAGAPFAAPA